MAERSLPYLLLLHQGSREKGNGDSKSLRIHAKERITLAFNTLLQPAWEWASNLTKRRNLAIVFEQREHSHSANGLVGIYLNGRCNFGDGFKQRKARGAVELAWGIFDFQKEQDVRIKFGYDISNQVPYFQIRENNWTVNADVHGKWNVRFDL